MERQIVTLENIADQLICCSFDDPFLHKIYHPEAGDLALCAIVPKAIRIYPEIGPLMLSFVEKHRRYCPACDGDAKSLINRSRRPLQPIRTACNSDIMQRETR